MLETITQSAYYSDSIFLQFSFFSSLLTFNSAHCLPLLIIHIVHSFFCTIFNSIIHYYSKYIFCHESTDKKWMDWDEWLPLLFLFEANSLFKKIVVRSFAALCWMLKFYLSCSWECQHWMRMIFPSWETGLRMGWKKKKNQKVFYLPWRRRRCDKYII